MDKNSKIILDFVKKEQELGLFNITIDNTVVYGFLCKDLRNNFLFWDSSSVDKDRLVSKSKKKRKYSILSFLQLLWISIFRKKIDNFIYSFYRVDKVGNYYLDKFTDPLIDLSSIKDSYIIFEKSNNFIHKTPRIHSSKTVYTDYIEQRAIKYAKKNKAHFIAQHKAELDFLWGKLDLLMDKVPYSKEWAVNRILRDKFLMDFYHKFFIKHHIKRFIAPCRPVFWPHMYVCKDLKIPVFELQHGLLLEEGVSYINYLDYHFVPDYFLSFGYLYNRERYGVENCKVINIGWALSDFIHEDESITLLPYNHVLVITIDLNINVLFGFIQSLARSFPDFVFHVRLHPLAKQTEYSEKVVKENANILIQDNTINVSVELSRFEMIIGDNSTVMSEALSYGKKVGRINYKEIIPEYFCEEEKAAEWEISDFESFKQFVESPAKKPNGLNPYTKFNQLVLEEALQTFKNV